MDTLRDLESKALTNKAIAKELGVTFEFKTDSEMLAHLLQGGDFPPGKKRRPIKQSRAPKFKEEDPE